MKIINPNEIGSKISTLISESNQTFCAVTPYLDLSKWKKILINLENAVKRNIKITFYFFVCLIGWLNFILKEWLTISRGAEPHAQKRKRIKGQ
mgnify:CR=1 FL=1